MTADLAQSCADIGRWLPVAQALIAEPDQDGATAGGQPDSRPPWNPSAALAYLDAYQEIRDIEHELRAEVTDRPEQAYRTRGPCRGGSHANALAALTAIPALAEAVDGQVAADVTRRLDRCTMTIQQLAAIDELERCQRVSGAECPYCHVPMLRLFPRSGRVTCIRHGVCFDGRDQHPVGFVQQGLDGTPLVAWADGLMQYGTAASTVEETP